MTDLDPIAHLDFHLCQAAPCLANPNGAEEAACVLMVPNACCLSKYPLCGTHMVQWIQMGKRHEKLLCNQHGSTTCAHLSWFEPLT